MLSHSGLTIQANMYYKMLINWTSQKVKETYATRNPFDFKKGMSTSFSLLNSHCKSNQVLAEFWRSLCPDLTRIFLKNSKSICFHMIEPNIKAHLHQKWYTVKISDIVTFPFSTISLFVFSDFAVHKFERSMMNNPGPCVLFATPGMISGGFSLEVFKHWAPSDMNLVTLPGYLHIYLSYIFVLFQLFHFQIYLFSYVCCSTYSSNVWCFWMMHLRESS